jgi:hypothetical protein
MNDTRDAVSGFLKEFWGEIKPLSDDADIFHNLGIDGDDAFEFIERFAAKFDIEITNYHWYFHHGEEGFLNIGGLFFRPPYRRVGRIPITPQVLAEAHSYKAMASGIPPAQTSECPLGCSAQSGFHPLNNRFVGGCALATLRPIRIKSVGACLSASGPGQTPATAPAEAVVAAWAALAPAGLLSAAGQVLGLVGLMTTPYSLGMSARTSSSRAMHPDVDARA